MSWVHDYYHAVDSMSMDAYLAWHTDNVRLRFSNNPTAQGKEAVASGLTQLWDSLQSLKHEFSAIWEVDNVAIAEANITYVRKDGHTVVLPCVTVLRRAGDLVDDVRIYMDLSPLFA